MVVSPGLELIHYAWRFGISWWFAKGETWQLHPSGSDGPYENSLNMIVIQAAMAAE